MINKEKAIKTIEALKNGNKPSTQELFELINAYEISMLSIQDKNNKTTLEMDVNYFESYKNVFEFGQLNTDTKCIVDQSDILSVEAKWIKETDMLYIECHLVNNKKLKLIIFHVESGQKLTASKDYYEISLCDLNKFLQDASGDKPKYSCSIVKIKNNFGFSMRMIYPKKASIKMTDDTNGELNIVDDVNYLKIDVMDDSCNKFYRKDNQASVEILVKPYNEPFMRIRMFFEKLSQ